MVTLTEAIVPNFPGIEKKEKTVNSASLAQNATEVVTITFGNDDFIIGVPQITTATSNATVQLYSGSGKNAVKVLATNTQAGAQAVACKATVYVVKQS